MCKTKCLTLSYCRCVASENVECQCCVVFIFFSHNFLWLVYNDVRWFLFGRVYYRAEYFVRIARNFVQRAVHTCSLGALLSTQKQYRGKRVLCTRWSFRSLSVVANNFKVGKYFGGRGKVFCSNLIACFCEEKLRRIFFFVLGTNF